MSKTRRGSTPKGKRTRLDDWLFWTCLIIIGGLFGYVTWTML